MRLIVVEEAVLGIVIVFSLCAAQRIRDPAKEALGKLVPCRDLKANHATSAVVIVAQWLGHAVTLANVIGANDEVAKGFVKAGELEFDVLFRAILSAKRVVHRLF